jgi:hypothetical protein
MATERSIPGKLLYLLDDRRAACDDSEADLLEFFTQHGTAVVTCW